MVNSLFEKHLNYNMKLILFISIFLIGLSSCKKTEIEDLPVGNSPVFKAEGMLNGEYFSLIAGEDDVIMETFTEKINGVNKYTGAIGNEKTSLEFGIYDGDIDQLNESVLNIGATEFWAVNPHEPLTTLSKFFFSNASSIQEIDWYLNGVFAGLNQVEIFLPGKYNVCANVTFFDGSQANLCNEIIIGYRRNENFQLYHTINSSGKLTAWIDPFQGEVENVSWELDNQLIGTSNTISYMIPSGGHKLKTTVNFADGTQRIKSVHLDGTLEQKFIDDFTVFEIKENSIQPWDYNILIRFKENGIIYRSDLVENLDSSIEIEKVEYYGLNNAGNKVYKLTANILANLKSASNIQKEISFKTEFGIEIK
jgi:hypothetical protein